MLAFAGLGLATPQAVATTCEDDADGDGYISGACGGTDCDDSDPSVHPGATDTPDDGIDQDCDGQDATNPDTDNDGLTDSKEAELGTDPLDPDTDDDGLTDGDEVMVHDSDPLDVDTDGDLFADGTEVDAGSDPANPTSFPLPTGGTLTLLPDPPMDELPVTDELEPIA